MPKWRRRNGEAGFCGRVFSPVMLTSDGAAASGKRRKILLPVILLVIAVAVASVLWFSIPGRKGGNRLVLYGNVDIRQVDLAFNANERIERVLAEEGDKVKEGQLLALLETNRLQHEVSQAEAQVRSQKEVVAALVAGTRPEEIRRARADVAAREAEADNAARTAKRLKFLAAKDLISKQEADDAEAAADSSMATLKAAKESLNLAIAGPRKEDIAAAKATLQALEEALAVARRNLAYAFLYAPSDGVIQSRVLEAGDMASPQKPVYTLALNQPVWVRAYVSETDLGKLRLGMAAFVETDSYPGKRYEAWIGFISPTAQFTPKSVETEEVRTTLVYQVRVYVKNPRDELRLGMPATVIVLLGNSGQDAHREERRNP